MRTNSTPIMIPAALLLLTVASAQDPRGRDAAAEAANVPKDGHLRRMDPDDARVPPEARFQLRAAAAAGDYRIDALVSGYEWPLNTVSYSFYEDSVFGGSYYGSETVREVSEPIKTNVRQIMAWYATIMNLNLVEVTETSNTIGLIRFMFSNGPSYAYAYYPSGTQMFSLAGDIHLNPAYDQATDTNGFRNPPGKHGYLALIHEIGHALGLKHSFEAPALPAEEDNESHTVMTYTFTGWSAGTPMGYDLMALQYLYGTRTHRTGDDLYLFTASGTDQYRLNGGTLHLETPNHARQTIWDSGGLNTLDMTGLPYNSTGYLLDLAGLGRLVANGVDRGNDFDYGTVIANAVEVRDMVNSGSSDTMYLNAQANLVKGYSATRATGNDVICAATSADTLDLSGYAPSQVTDTQVGSDRVLGFGANGSVTIKGYYSGNAINVSYSPETPAFRISDTSVNEGNGGTTAISFTVTLSAASSIPLTVKWQTADGTATSGSDYVAADPQFLNFPAGTTSQPVTVTVNGDGTPEADEVFYVNLSEPSTGAVIGDGQGVGTILNDDVNQPPVAVATASPTSGTAPLDVGFNGSGSSDPEASPLAYAWDFGDGGSSTLANPGHTYTRGGSFTAVLTVTDNLGATGTDSVTITVTEPPLSIPAMSPQGGTYKYRDTVTITATVLSGSSPAAGATVVFSMWKQSARKATKYTATTNASGVASWAYKVARTDKPGLYTVTAKATLGSQTADSVSPHAYFNVQ